MELIDKFRNPGKEFSPMPFWFWNDIITEKEIKRQMTDFCEKGVHGFVLHPRMGLSKETGYLTGRFLALVAYTVELAQEMGMKVVLYDEAMYPSGSAHGMVVKENPAYAARGIRLYPKDTVLTATQRLVAKNQEYAIIEDFTGGTIRGVHPGEDDGEENAPPAANLLDQSAMEAFIRLTHEKYYSALKPHFGKTVIGMFTDEPSPTGRNVHPDTRAWTKELDRLFPVNDLFALWLDVGEQTTAIRRRYDGLIMAQMAQTYYGPLKAWCENHGIALTGHPHDPDCMAAERLFTIPGQDVVWRWVAPEKGLGLYGKESTQAKCASSAARHSGSRRNSNECFGCCGKDGNLWDFTADDMKWYLDWLFARGANLLYPHAFFYSVKGPIQFNERPPDVGPNNYFWPHYHLFATYISRMCAMLTDGIHQTRVAVLCSGTELPYNLPAKLFEKQIDFNYLEGDTLLAAPFKDGFLRIANQQYDALLVEDESLLTPEIKAHFKGTIAGDPDALKGYETVVLEPPSKNIRASHYRHGEKALFLLTNEGEEGYAGRLHLPVTGATEKWDPWTGTAAAIEIPYGLKLERRQALLFVVDQNSENEPEAEPAFAYEPLAMPFQWQLNGQPIKELAHWQSFEGMTLYNGAAEYTTTFLLRDVPPSLLLDLGDVREMAEVSLNGGGFIPLLLKPFLLECAPYLHLGENQLAVRVTSSNVSRFTGLPHPCGLLGPVTFNQGRFL